MLEHMPGPMMELDLDLPTFKKIEIFAWGFAATAIVFCFRYFFVSLIFAIAVRYAYIRFKTSKLGFIPTGGKSVIVTGCDSGFGLGLATRLCHQGFYVFATCLDMDSDGAKSLLIKQKEFTHRLEVLHLDITDDSMVQEVLARVRDECDGTGLWGLVNNAGQNFMGDIELTTMRQYERLAEVNLFGMVRMCKAFLPLVRQAKGRIVNITSVKGLFAFPQTAAYTMAKYGGEAFSDILRQEVAASGIKVIIIEPGNFGGLTGCLNSAGLSRMKTQLDTQWQEASEDVRRFYGKPHLQKQLEVAKKSAGTTSPTLEPVLNAVEDGLRNVCPHVRYIVDGSNSYFDIYTVIARIAPYLPVTLLNKLCAYFFPYIIYK